MSTNASRVPNWRLWLSLLGAPALWLIHFLLAYAVTEAVCSGAVHATLASSVHTALVVVTLLFALACGVLTAFNFRARRKVVRTEAALDDVFGKVGFAMGLLFTFALLLETLPLFFLQPCS